MKISIITVCYNSIGTIRRTLDSIKAQTFRDIEYIVIDGASTDGTVSVIRESGVPVACLVSEKDQGIYDAMNKGVACATGDVVGILNSDDEYANATVLERVAKAFANPEVIAVYGDVTFCDPDGRLRRYWKAGGFRRSKFLWGWMPPHPTVFLRRSIYADIGTFRLDLKSAADYELLLRIFVRERKWGKYLRSVLVTMSPGGASDRSLYQRLEANRMDSKAWRVNGLKPFPWTVPLKPFRKIPQFLFKHLYSYLAK